uniref:Ig-like domain-containing protein n=1 Tax=Caenorhabditis tropicalis TaxID=1561998 RepID=A0A1I7U7A2_9PELO
MECHLEADPQPTIAWQHSGNLLEPSGRVVQTLTPLGGSLYKATLVIKEPNAGDGGAYKCTAKNQLGESNANINLNFAGAGGDEAKSRGPSFVGKPRIIPKDGGALIVMECKVKSASTPVAKWMKDGVPLSMGGLYHAIFSDLGDQTYLCQLEIRGPSSSDAGQYRCNIRNDQGETNANLALNFEEPDPSERQERKRSTASPRPSSRGPGSRPSSPKKSMKSREGTPKRTLKPREGSPSKKLRDLFDGDLNRLRLLSFTWRRFYKVDSLVCSSNENEIILGIIFVLTLWEVSEVETLEKTNKVDTHVDMKAKSFHRLQILRNIGDCMVHESSADSTSK